MSIIFSIILIFCAGLYAAFTKWIHAGLGKLKVEEDIPQRELPTVSVIVPARNEDNNIEETLESLAAQNYPKDKFQVVMVNDRSTDHTSGLMTIFTKKYSNFVQVDVQHLPPGISPKKNALEWGITAANGEIIVTTDADCVHSPRWIRTLANYFKPDVGLVAGLTIFDPDDESWWHRLHSLDYLSHSFIGAGAIGEGSGMNCTGANLAYRYSVFIELKGYGDKTDMVSGDDEFFLQSLVKTVKWKAVHALGADSVVRSLPPETLNGIINQRQRWGSKGLYYPPKIKKLAIGLFIYFLLLIISPALVLLNLLPSYIFGIALVVKIWSDLKVMARGCKIFDLKFPALTFIFLSAIHPLVIIVSAALGHLVAFDWKGDAYRSRVPSQSQRSNVG